MEYTLESLREHEMFRWFIEISSVPRGSGNTKAISELTADFASVRGLQYERDALGNVVITKPASPRKENCEPIMLQAHLDMVCAAQSGKNIDMSVTPPQLVIDGDWLRADGTTLGADNGIGVAMMFALLDNTDTVHPPLVCVFTVDEETGMEGAYGLDKSRLGSRRMLNLDAEREGEFFAGCAGGNKAVVRIPVTSLEQDGDSWRIELDGLAGGHSGVDIDRGRAAAPVLMGRVLMELRCSAEMRCARLECGQADNAIADHATADVVCAAGFDLPGTLASLESTFHAEYGITDPGLHLRAERIDLPKETLDDAGTDKLICLLLNVPQGVIERSSHIAGMPQTSSNLGVVRVGPDGIPAEACIRSAVATQQDWINLRFASLVKSLGGTVERCRGAGAWEFVPGSPLRAECIMAWKELFGVEPAVRISHAGAECGIFVAEMPGLDCVSLGPTIENVHTPNERLNIESSIRVYNYLKYVIARL